MATVVVSVAIRKGPWTDRPHPYEYDAELLDEQRRTYATHGYAIDNRHVRQSIRACQVVELVFVTEEFSLTFAAVSVFTQQC